MLSLCFIFPSRAPTGRILSRLAHHLSSLPLGTDRDPARISDALLGPAGESQRTLAASIRQPKRTRNCRHLFLPHCFTRGGTSACTPYLPTPVEPFSPPFKRSCTSYNPSAVPFQGPCVSIPRAYRKVFFHGRGPAPPLPFP